MLTTLRQRKTPRGSELKADPDSHSAKESRRDHWPPLPAHHRSHATDSDGAPGDITAPDHSVKAVCELARARGVETIVDGAHSFGQFDFKTEGSGL